MVDALSTPREGKPVAPTISRTRRLVAVAFAVAAAGAPAFVATMSTGADPAVTATPACLAWFGNKDEGHCLSYSNGQPIVGGTPLYNGGNGPHSGVSSGPLMPGTTINQGIG
jgi:hypothetical protein